MVIDSSNKPTPSRSWPPYPIIIFKSFMRNDANAVKIKIIAKEFSASIKIKRVFRYDLSKRAVIHHIHVEVSGFVTQWQIQKPRIIEKIGNVWIKDRNLQVWF